jgi:hypothetical protein
MRMSELVSSLGLSIYPIIGLIGFGTAFLFIHIRAAYRTRDEMAANAALPLADGTSADRAATDPIHPSTDRAPTARGETA